MIRNFGRKRAPSFTPTPPITGLTQRTRRRSSRPVTGTPWRLRPSAPESGAQVNGELVNDVDLSKIDRSKLTLKEKGPTEADLDRKTGRIGLQSFRGQAKFRNIRIKELGQ